MTDRSAHLEQALVDAESLRAQAELTRVDNQAVYEAAREALLSSERAVAAATRTSDLVRQLVDAEVVED